jgi:hypothetical protein
LKHKYQPLTLKRRLTDRGHVTKQFIRPAYINDALHMLKTTNPHYGEVVFNEDWIIQSQPTDNAFLLDSDTVPQQSPPPFPQHQNPNVHDNPSADQSDLHAQDHVHDNNPKPASAVQLNNKETRPTVDSEHEVDPASAAQPNNKETSPI